jgi:hypothetical protein
MMFLVSFLVVEGLVVLSATLRGRYNVIRPPQIHLWPHGELLLNEGVNKRLALMRTLNHLFSVTSLTFHSMLLYLAFVHLWGTPEGFQDSFPIDILAIIMLILVLLSTQAFEAVSVPLRRFSRKTAIPRLFEGFCLMMTLFLGDYLLQYVQKLFDIGSISDSLFKSGVFTAAFVIVYTFLALMNSFCRELGKQLLLGRQVEWDGPFIRENHDFETYVSLEFFIFTLTISVFWYCYRFDPTGTVNPQWTGIFG